jgi:amino acid transporter
LYAGAKDGLFPKVLGKIHPRYATPYLAVITYSAVIFLFSISGGFRQLAILASGALLIIYLAVILSMIKLRIKGRGLDEKSFKVPGGLIIPIVAIVVIFWLLFHLSNSELSSILIFIALLCGVYFVMKRRSGLGKV